MRGSTITDFIPLSQHPRLTQPVGNYYLTCLGLTVMIYASFSGSRPLIRVRCCLVMTLTRASTSHLPICRQRSVPSGPFASTSSESILLFDTYAHFTTASEECNLKKATNGTVGDVSRLGTSRNVLSCVSGVA